MFYSHQLLARKAPLGQIWMAATLHGKIDRRKLNKINLIQICEEILNPAVPMALRLSGILMGGVVIVYERKVKLLYDDVNRLLIDINKVWKIKAITDSTVLPKGKSQAKFEAVTLPEKDDSDIGLGEIENSLHFASTAAFQQTAYFSMRLDDVDINSFSREVDDSTQHFHQADPADITLFERFESFQTETIFDNRFERVDIGDEGVQVNLSSQDHPHIPDSLIPSPPGQVDPQKAFRGDEKDDGKISQGEVEIPNQPPEAEVNLFGESRGADLPHQDHERHVPKRRRGRRQAPFFMDFEQTVIPGQVYQAWLHDASDIVSRGGRKRKRKNCMSYMKIADLMDLPPLILACDLLGNGNQELHYPPRLLELWRNSNKTPHDSPSGTSRHQPSEPSSSSPPDIMYDQDFAGPSEDINNGDDFESLSIERTRAVTHELPAEFLKDILRTNLLNNGVGVTETNVVVTPGNSGDEHQSISSSASGHGFSLHNPDIISGRKRAHSSSRRSGSGLETVAEEYPWQEPVPHFKLAKLSENGLTPDELLMETGPTQTQLQPVHHPIDQITDSIRMHLKTHFDTPGAPQVESLDQLASGMSRKSASLLFYQTCVLASQDFLRVEQKVPFGDILISRGKKM